MQSENMFVEEIRKNLDYILNHMRLGKEMLFQEKSMFNSLVEILTLTGEAMEYISDEFKMKNPQVSWGPFDRLRERLKIEGFGEDTEHAWEVMEKDLQEVKEELEKIEIADNDRDSQ